MLIHAAAFLAFYYVLCSLYHTYVRHTGKEERFYKSVFAAPLLGDAAVGSAAGSGGGAGSRNGGGSGSSGNLGSSGVEEVVAYLGIVGDLGTALVAEEVLVDRVYFRHGITLRGASVADPPLVIDVGAHIGLFALSVLRERDDVVIVGAEPVPQLHALAVKNTAPPDVRGSAQVFMEQMALGTYFDAGIDLVVDPFITAGTSAYLPQITQPLRADPYRGLFAFLRAVGLDLVRAGVWPYFPTAALCHAMEVPVLRELVLLLASPLLLLAAVFYCSGPHDKTRVRSHQGPLGELLERAARRAEAAAADGDGSAVAQRIRGPDSPIDLVKIDVEGGEMAVLEGITEAEWGRIRQLVVEVHDLDGRVAAIRKLLAARGFNHVVVDTGDWVSHELLRIASVYAKKIGHP